MPQKKLQSSLIFSVFIIGFLILGSRSFAQVPEDTAESTEAANTTTAPTAAPAATATDEEHNTQDLEELLKRYNTDQKKVLEDTSKIHTIEESSEVNDATIEEMRPESTDLDPAVFLAKKMKAGAAKDSKDKPNSLSSELSASVRMALEPLQQMSEQDLLKRLKETSQKSKMGHYLNMYPKLGLFTVRLVKDKESIPSLVKIIENRDRLIRFSGLMICTIIFGFFLKRIMHREGRTFLRAMIFFFIRLAVLTALRIFIIYLFFGDELAPAFKIYKQTFI